MTMSSSYKTFSLFFFFFVSIFFRCSVTTVAQTFYLDHVCSTNKTFTANSSFQSDLTTTLSTLASQNVEFYNTTIASSGDTVYGLFMCRGDVSPQVCHQCVVDATQRLPSECPISKAAVIWYNECMLRYSNRSFFSIMATKPRTGLYNTGNMTDQASFMRLLYKVMNETADVAAKPALGKKKYATKEVNISGSQTLYCLAQCTPDLSPDDCRMCLSRTIGGLDWCCKGRQGGRVLNPSCNVRYELYPFYGPDARDQMVAPTPAPAAAPSPAANSSDPQVKKKGQSSPTTIVIVVVSIIGSGLLLGFAYYLLWRKMKKRRRDVLRQKYFGSEGTTLEPLQFSLATIETATNQFSHENSLGKGGFGQVYKGILSNGQEIAVKRLSKVSGQGAEEFKNEVLLIAKLQHRNLVALLGFYIDEQEKILIYEYVPNRSMDYFLFGSQNSKVLTWLERSKIIKGVAQGILYLHDYSRLKIIHRDLKPSNILLDDEMNPKISDFGLAKMVAIHENEGNTNIIVGTYGYMSPEYAMFGQYSNKSDVFNFGVIILEIISGRKNASRHNQQSQYADSLLSYAWNQWKDEEFLEILDSNLKDLESLNEIIKCIQIGLLCVQENPEARPSMATIISYLSDDSIQLPIPQEPAFFLHGRMDPNNVQSQSGESCSTNEVSKSEFFPR